MVIFEEMKFLHCCNLSLRDVLSAAGYQELLSAFVITGTVTIAGWRRGHGLLNRTKLDRNTAH